MDEYEIASALFGNRREEELARDHSTTTVFGTAVSTSEDGLVEVDYGGDVTNPEDAEGEMEGGTTVLVPTSPHVVEGDAVAVTFVGGDALTPYVSEVFGGGDRVDGQIADAQGAADAAQAQLDAFQEAQEELNAELDGRVDAADAAIAQARSDMSALDASTTAALAATQADLDSFKSTASATYSTKTEVDEATGALSRSIEAAYAATAPNLSPFLSHDFGDRRSASSPDGYWGDITTARLTQLGDGWAHYEYENTGTVTVNTYIRPRAEDVRPGGLYTLLLEFRNVSISGTGGSVYSQQDRTSQVWGTAAYGGFSVSNNAIAALEGGAGAFRAPITFLDAEKRDKTGTVRNSTLENLIAVNLQATAGQSLSYDIRLSLYEGEYTGPYRPYVEDYDAAARTYATKHELSDTADSLESTFEATYLSKADAQATYTTQSSFSQAADSISQTVQSHYETLQQVSGDLEDYKDANDEAVASLQSQLDGQIEAWYYQEDPSASNPPASTWATDAERERHRGDLYYNVSNGHSWRWMRDGQGYSWQQIPDSDAAAALAAAQAAQATADGKRRIFTATPTAPYDVGDLWVDGSVVRYATQLRTGEQPNGQYHPEDWALTATDDTAALAAQTAAAAAQATADTAGNPNLSPFFSRDLADVYSATGNPNGYWVARPTNTTQLEDGWAHVSLDNSSGTGTKYANVYVRPIAGLPRRSTLLVEVRNLDTDVTSTTSEPRLWLNYSATTATCQASGPIAHFMEDGAMRIAMTDLAHPGATYFSRGWFAINAGARAEFDVRLSLYEGEYTGPYKPYVDAAALREAQADISSIRTTYATKAELTTTDTAIRGEVTQAIATARSYTDGRIETEASERAAAIEASASGIRSEVSSSYATKEEFAALEIGGRNLLAGIAGKPAQWTHSTAAKFEMTVEEVGSDAYSAAYGFIATSGYELLYSPAIDVEVGQSYALSLDYEVLGAYDYANRSSCRGYGLSVRGAGTLASYDDTDANYRGRVEFPNAVTPRTRGSLVFTAASTPVHLVFNGGMVRDDNARHEFRVWNVKLEKGNRATDWSPAPEDAQAALDAVAANLSANYYTKAQQDITDNAIRQSVTESVSTAQSYTDGRISQEVADRNSAISQSASEIGMSVSQTYATKEQLSGVESVANGAFVEYVIGTQTAATGAWTGVSETISELAEGVRINYRLPFAGSGNATLNLTLADGTATGAKSVYRYGTTTLTTQYPAGSVIPLIYNGTAWQVDGATNTDTNYYDRMQYKVSVAASTAIPAGRLAAFGADGKLMLLGSTESVDGATRPRGIDLSRPVLYVATAYTADNVAAGTARNTNYTFWGSPFNLASTHAVTGGAAGKAVYLVGEVQGRMLYPADEVLTCTEPAEPDGLYYVRLGIMNTAANALLESEHPVFARLGGSFQRVDSGHVAYATSEYARSADLQVTAETIQGVVSGLAQSSRFQQTEDGFSFDIDAELDGLRDGIEMESGRIDELANHVRVTRNQQGMTELELGASVSPIVAVLANNGLLFRMADSSDLPAYIEVDGDGVARLKVTEARVIENIQFGNWRFYERSNGNMSVKYVGGDS